MKSPIKIVDEFIQEVKISDEPSEKPEEVIFAIAWMTAFYYGIGSLLLMQLSLLLDGIQKQSKYEITTSQFWVDYIILSFTTGVIGTMADFIIGIIHGGLISLIYQRKAEVSAQPKLFKMVVYLVNLLAPTVIILIVFLNMKNQNFDQSIEFLGLGYMAFAAAAFYVSRRFWKWWIQDNRKA